MTSYHEVRPCINGHEMTDSQTIGIAQSTPTMAVRKGLGVNILPRSSLSWLETQKIMPKLGLPEIVVNSTVATTLRNRRIRSLNRPSLMTSKVNKHFRRQSLF